MCLPGRDQENCASIADFLQESWFALHFFFDVVHQCFIVCVNNDIHIFDGIMDFPDADLQLRSGIGRLPGVGAGATDLLHCDLSPERCAPVACLIVEAHGSIGLLGLFKANVLQLLAPVGHC